MAKRIEVVRGSDQTSVHCAPLPPYFMDSVRKYLEHPTPTILWTFWTHIGENIRKFKWMTSLVVLAPPVAGFAGSLGLVLSRPLVMA